MRLHEPTYLRALIVLAVCLGMAVSAGQACAADLDPGYADVPTALPQQNVSFGSGWYVRGDIAATELYGMDTARGPDRSVYSGLRRAHDVGYDLSLGGGYAFTNNVRGDIIADFHQPIQAKVFNVPCVSTPSLGCDQVGRFDHYDALANVYYDFGTWSIVTPYVGAGAGVGFGNVRADLYGDTNLYSSYRGYHSFAWALMAGAAFDVYQHVKLDVGYRFLNNGNVAGTNIYYHEVRAGLRYMIDN